MEMFWSLLLFFAGIAMFVGYYFLHKHLDVEWEKTPVDYVPNGNGKHLVLSTINGIGFRLCGEYRHQMVGDQDSYATYYSFCFFFVPIFAIRCYRVVPSSANSYYILGSEKTDFRELLCLWFSGLRWVATILGAVLFVIFLFE